MVREAEGRVLDGIVEVDGAYFGGHVKPANERENRRDRRLSVNQNGKRQSVVPMRERDGETLTIVGKSEAAGVAVVRERVDADAIGHADEAIHWNALHGSHDTRRINYSRRYSDDMACTN